MGLFDDLTSKLKGASDEESVEEAQEAAEETPMAAGPSRITRSLMTKSAEFVLSTSQKALAVGISNQRDAVRPDVILRADQIRRVLESSDQARLSARQRARLATHSLATLPVARELLAELAEPEASSKEGDSSNEDDSERLALEELRGIVAVMDHIVGERGGAAVEGALALRAANPAFSHPLIASHVAMSLDADTAGLSEVRSWCDMALSYNPLNANVLARLLKDGDPDDEQVWRQLRNLAGT